MIAKKGDSEDFEIRRGWPPISWSGDHFLHGGNHPREWAPAAFELLTLAQEEVSLDHRRATGLERIWNSRRRSTRSQRKEQEDGLAEV